MDIIVLIFKVISTSSINQILALYRRRRQAEFTDENRAELLTAVAEHKMEMLEKLGNFSCAMMKMGIFNEEGRNHFCVPKVAGG